MFNILYRCPRTVARHENGPLHALCRYIEVERGLSPATIATVRQSVTKFFRYIRVLRLSALKIADMDRFLILAAGPPDSFPGGLLRMPRYSDEESPLARRCGCSGITVHI